jgi:hypothetical protein
MNYSLGNMLGRGGALNPDGLSLDLAFATDKTLTARKGPTPTFTRASTATFVGSDGLIQSAAINTPRFDHDPVTLACKGLLIEEARTNNLLHSSNFKDTTSSNYWTNISATTITVDQTTSPDGGSNADLLTTSTTPFDCFTRRNFFWNGSTTYCYSIFIKRGPSNYRYVGFYIGAGASATQFPYFDFDNPTSVILPTITSGTINSTGVDAYPNGWYRIKIKFTTAVTPITTVAGVYISSSNGTLQSINNAGDNCYIWGIQSELGEFPTSYIPTTTAALTRSADVCSITGGDFTGFWNQSAGTLVEVFEASPNTNTTYVAASNGNIAANSVHIDNDTGLMRSVYYSGSSIVATLNLGAVGTVGSVNKVATAYSVNDFAASRNGGSAVTDTSGALPIGLSQMNIGADERSQVPTSFFSNKCISSLRYYNKRLPNAKLQSLTT